ncbi:MAG: hypothetical protein M0001_00745 [Treponema sp.]|nr:hypothetical protein [Treponema sp.]
MKYCFIIAAGCDERTNHPKPKTAASIELEAPVAPDYSTRTSFSLAAPSAASGRVL